MKICGPKCALCGLLISIWGIIQLVLMGIFFYVESVALIEDIPIAEEGEAEGEHGFKSIDDFYAAATRGYTQNAYNCWIAACLYVLTLLFSGHQFYVNNRTTLTM